MQIDFHPTHVWLRAFFFAIINFLTMTFLDAIEIRSDGGVFVCGAFRFNKFLMYVEISPYWPLKTLTYRRTRCKWKRWKWICAAAQESDLESDRQEETANQWNWEKKEWTRYNKQTVLNVKIMLLLKAKMIYGLQMAEQK